MEQVALLLPALLCVGGMALCMWLMNRGHRTNDRPHAATTPPPEPADDRLAALEEEVRQLHAELRLRDQRNSAGGTT